MSLLQKAKHILRYYNFSPKKRLGQNFSINTRILNQLIEYAAVSKDDIILEVGPGLGFLTRLLSLKCKKVIAVEIDPKLFKILKNQLCDFKNVHLIEGDILNVSLPQFNKVISTPPYSISSPLLFHLLERNFDKAVLILQKEFSERLAASVGTKNYGRLTVNIYYKAHVELLDFIPKTMFFPSPDVDSMIVRLTPKIPSLNFFNKKILFELVRMLFNQRNKKVRNALIPFIRKNKITVKEAKKLSGSSFYSIKRVRELTPEDFIELTKEIIEKLDYLIN